MWRFATAQAPGTSHLRSGLSCQDSLAYSIPREETFFAAVADGAGSASMAEMGAQTVVLAVHNFVRQAFLTGQTDPLEILSRAATSARDQLSVVARDHGKELREFASTLMAVIIGPQGGAALQIGDGVIVVSEEASEWCWVFWPQHGEFANTTHFLTDEDATGYLQVDKLSDAVTDIALTTDGLEALALHYASRSVYSPFFQGIFNPLHRAEGIGEIISLSNALEAFIKSERVSARTDDDVSIIIATRRPILTDILCA